MVTEIPWGDGSGDLIYLSYSASEGNQTVLVSSDANSGVARTKNITFVSTVGNISRTLTVSQEEPYIVFADSAVETICANTWGDGVGLKPSQAAQVTSIGYTFRENANITSFDEFRYFTGVTKVMRNNSTTARGAFGNCTALKSITLPNSITQLEGSSPSGNYRMGAPFYNCTSLERINIPSSVTQIGSGATYQSVFFGCTSLSRVDITDLYKYVGINFANVTSTFRGAAPFGSSTAEERAIYLNGEKLVDVLIPDRITTVPGAAFCNCNAIKTVDFNDATSIDQCAFYGCSGLTSIDLSSVKTIGAYAFYQCAGLTSLSIPSSVTSIGQYAFYRCTGISGTLTIPSTITTINNYAFQGLSSITNAVFNRDTSSNVWMYGGMGIYFGNGTGTLTINGDLTLAQYGSCAMFLHYNITGDFIKQNSGGYGGLLRDQGGFKPLTIRIGGDIDTVGGSIFYYSSNFNNFKFIEVGGTINNTWLSTSSSITANCIMHLGYEGIAGTAANCAASAGWITKIYVGDGSSAAHDDAILAQYTADTDWSAYSSKLDTWYNYINDPNANPDYIN